MRSNASGGTRKDLAPRALCGQRVAGHIAGNSVYVASPEWYISATSRNTRQDDSVLTPPNHNIFRDWMALSCLAASLDLASTTWLRIFPSSEVTSPSKMSSANEPQPVFGLMFTNNVCSENKAAIVGSELPLPMRMLECIKYKSDFSRLMSKKLASPTSFAKNVSYSVLLVAGISDHEPTK